MAAEFELRHDMAGEDGQGFLLRVRELARLLVNDAERTQRVAVGRDQRRAGIETNFGLRRDERIRFETPVLGRA